MKRKDLPEDYPSSYLCGSCLNCLVGYKSFWDSRKPSEWLRWITNIQSGIWWINKRQKHTQNSVDHFLVFAISSNVKSYFKAFSQVGMLQYSQQKSSQQGVNLKAKVSIKTAHTCWHSSFRRLFEKHSLQNERWTQTHHVVFSKMSHPIRQHYSIPGHITAKEDKNIAWD